MAELTDAERQIVRQCADLFFSEHGTVQENIYRVAAAAFIAGRQSVPMDIERVGLVPDDAGVADHVADAGKKVALGVDSPDGEQR